MAKKKSKRTRARMGYIIAFLASVAVFATGVVADYFEYPYTPDPQVRMQMSVVKLLTQKDGGGGTGFVVKAKSGRGVTVTNYHVCSHTKIKEGSDTFMLAYREGEFSEVKTKVLSYDAAVDLCVLEGVPGYPLTLGGKPERFKEISLMGHPLLKPLTPAKGEYVGEVSIDIPLDPSEAGTCPPGSVAQVGFFGTYCIMPLIVGDTNIFIFPGNSGSPVIDRNGDIVGVMESHDTRTGWGSFIPVRFLRTMLEKY